MKPTTLAVSWYENEKKNVILTILEITPASTSPIMTSPSSPPTSPPLSSIPISKMPLRVSADSASELANVSSFCLVYFQILFNSFVIYLFFLPLFVLYDVDCKTDKTNTHNHVLAPWKSTGFYWVFILSLTFILGWRIRNISKKHYYNYITTIFILLSYSKYLFLLLSIFMLVSLISYLFTRLVHCILSFFGVCFIWRLILFILCYHITATVIDTPIRNYDVILNCQIFPSLYVNT